MRLASGDATVKGMISRSAVDLTFTAAIASSRNLPVRTGGSFSSLTANGTIRGAWKSLHINLAAQARQLAFQGVTVQSASLKANLFGLPPQSGNLVLQGTNLQTKAGTFRASILTPRVREVAGNSDWPPPHPNTLAWSWPGVRTLEKGPSVSKSDRLPGRVRT